ncbi:MAG TPA: hypothetical protein VFB60_16705 [Ktedonobacteraceae bacterium]|nr:hypothetical protein [Ktedonobacteraceae bacterium]
MALGGGLALALERDDAMFLGRTGDKSDAINHVATAGQADARGMSDQPVPGFGSMMLLWGSFRVDARKEAIPA